MKKFKNKSLIIRAPHDKDNTYTVVSNYWNNPEILNGFERAIMLEVMTNSDEFIVHKSTIQKRLGFHDSDFQKAWKSLENKGYIYSFKNGMVWEYAIREQPLHTVKNSKVKQGNKAIDRLPEDGLGEEGRAEAYKQVIRETSTNQNKPESQDLSTQAEIETKGPIQTDSILSPGGERSQSVAGNIPDRLKPELFEYSVLTEEIPFEFNIDPIEDFGPDFGPEYLTNS